MRIKCSMFNRRAVSPIVATTLLVAIFTILVAVALSVSQDVLSGGYTQSDSSQAASVCGALAGAVNRVGFSYGEAESVGYTFWSSSLAFIPSALVYTISFSNGESISVSTGVLVVATPATHFSYGGGYYETVYPAGGGHPVAPSTGSVVWSIQDEDSVGKAEYVFTALFPLPELVNTGITVGGEQLWRIYMVNLVGGSSVESFAKSGYVSVEGLGQKVYSYGGVTGLSVQVSSLTQAYTTSFFKLNTTQTQFNDGVLVQVVVANVSLSGSTVV
ncbi:MAG: hypothetical protein QW453_00195 [Thermoprotei archaeon]